jgi:hypothetical protein
VPSSRHGSNTPDIGQNCEQFPRHKSTRNPRKSVERCTQEPRFRRICRFDNYRTRFLLPIDRQHGKMADDRAVAA